MTIARRSKLKPEGSASHAGLLFQRYLEAHKPQADQGRRELKQMPEEKLLDEATKIVAGEEYKIAFKRWKTSSSAGMSTFSLELAASLAIGLGNENPLEVGLTVHHTYGMPLIPGSAIKGLCRRGAGFLKNGDNGIDQFYTLFGSTKENGGKDSAGYVTFYDAWYDPDSVGGKPFHRDVVTVHHPEYYGSRGSSAPTDFDDPTPVPFLVVKKGARFFFAIQAPNTEWGDFTANLMKWCLINLGVGAKTNAGYGYFEAERLPSSAQTAPAATQQQSAQFSTEIQRWENVTVSFNPGSREIRASYKGQNAVVAGSAADNLLSKLSEEARNKLRYQKRIVADIEVEVQGNRKTIVNISPK